MLRPTLLLALVAFATATAPAARADEEAGPGETARAEWTERDREGRWALLRRGNGISNPDLRLRWVDFLAERGDFETLEWMVIYGDWADAGPALFDASAPQWIRAAVFSLGDPDSHGSAAARQALVDDRPRLALAWFEAHPQAVTGPAVEVYQALRAKAPPPDDAARRALPPLVPGEVLSDLDAPPDLADFGDRKRAEPGRRYLHQVLRAIDGLMQSGLRSEPWAGKLAALAKHPHPAVRRAALLAYTRWPRNDLPLDLLLAARDDAAETPAVRESAVLALAHSSHPRAYAELIATAADPKHPAWKAVLSGLAGIDDGFLLEHVRPGALDLDDETRRFAESEVARVRARVDDMKPDRWADAAQRLLERAAWVDLGCDPLEGTLVPWTLKTLGAQAGEARVRAVLERIRDGYEARVDTRRGPLQDRVRSYARRLLGSGGD